MATTYYSAALPAVCALPVVTPQASGSIKIILRSDCITFSEYGEYNAPKIETIELGCLHASKLYCICKKGVPSRQGAARLFGEGRGGAMMTHPEQQNILTGPFTGG